MPPRILLADCDSYFVRCAMLADPEDAGRAELLIVGGRAEGRGVVTSASYAARRYGVHAGMPTTAALRLCPGAMLVPVPGEMVRRKHAEVRAVLDRFAPRIEAASVDEFYLDLTGTERLYRGEPLEQTARRIQRAVMEETGIAISVGGATRRILAKMAAGVNKPMGVHVVAPGEEAEFLRGFALAEIPGVGPAFQQALHRRGVSQVREVERLDRATLVSWLGEGRGGWLFDVLHGAGAAEEGDAVAPPANAAVQKSVSHERTYPRDLAREAEIEAGLLALAVEVGATLRADGYRARTVTVRLRGADFADHSASRTLPEPIASDRAIHAAALALLRTLRQRRRGPVRLLGISLAKLSTDADEAAAPLTLFAAEPLDSARDRKLSAAADRVRERFGAGALRPGTLCDPPTPRTAARTSSNPA